MVALISRNSYNIIIVAKVTSTAERQQCRNRAERAENQARRSRVGRLWSGERVSQK